MNVSSASEKSTPDSGNAEAGKVDSGSLLETLPHAVLLVDAVWTVEYANAEALKLAGKGKAEVHGRTLWSVFPTLAASDIEQNCRRVMEDGVTRTLDREITSGRWLEIQAQPYRDGLALFVRDVTRSRVAERILRERDEELSDFFENANVALHWVGPDGTILWANDTELRFLGYAPKEYIGHHITEFHADKSVIEDILKRLAENQTLHNYQASLRCKDGSVRVVAINSSVYRKDGKFIHTRCFTRDLMASEDAALVHERLAAIVESSDDAVISKDLNGIIRSWNKGAERIFGYTEAEAIGQPISMLAAPDRGEEIPNILERITRGERIDHYRTNRKAKDGRILSISLTVSPIRNSLGRIVGASKVARDISEQITSEAALRAANEALSHANADLEHFAYSASHDLQEPLRMVSTYSEMLRRKFGGQLAGNGEEYLGYLIEGAARMEQLLGALRDFTRVSATSQGPEKDLDTNESFSRVLANLKPAIESNGVTVTRGALPFVRMHEFQMEQLLQNLIGNAIRYRSETAPALYVSAQRDAGFWTFSVQDNGIGIEPQYKEQIFGIFKRLHSSADYPGTGMGLAICERIVRRGGGRIWVESEPGVGSTFFFTVPAARDVNRV